MVRLAYLSVVAILGLTGLAAADASAGRPACRVTMPSADECKSGWASGNRYLIRASTTGRNNRFEWQFDFATNRDLRISVVATSGKGTETGTVFLIDNRTMLSQGLTLIPGQEIDILGVPVLSLQLVLDLLQRGVPNGPSAVAGRQAIRDADDDVALKISTRNASGVVPAPWRLGGTVERMSPSRITFQLALAFRPVPDDTDERVMHFAGSWEVRPTPPRLPDATTIEGWAVHRITRNMESESGIALRDSHAMPVHGSFPTLGALRRYFLGKSPAAEHPR